MNREVTDPLTRPRTERFSIFGYRCAVATSSAVAHRLLRRLYAPFAVDAGEGAAIDRQPLGFAAERSAAGSREAPGREVPRPRHVVEAWRGNVPAAETPEGEGCFQLETEIPGDRRWRLLQDDGLLSHAGSLGAALQRLEYEICRQVIAHRPDLLALHGATVFTGASGAGKTTLVLALAAQGYAVGGDDIALFDPRAGALWPLPRCFHLDQRSWTLVRQARLSIPVDAARHRFLTPADLGMVTPHTAPLRQVLLLAPGPDHEPRLTPLSQAEVSMGLLPQLHCASASPERAVAALPALLGEAAGYRLLRGDLAPTVAAVIDVLGPP